MLLNFEVSLMKIHLAFLNGDRCNQVLTNVLLRRTGRYTSVITNKDNWWLNYYLKRAVVDQVVDNWIVRWIVRGLALDKICRKTSVTKLSAMGNAWNQ